MKKIFIILFLISQFSWGQTPIDYQKEDYYFLERSHFLKVELIKGNLKIKNNVFEKAKYNTGNNLYYANEFIHFDSFTDIKDIDAFTEVDSGNEKITVGHFETKDQFGGGVFFSDQQSINFVFPAVGKGAITTLSYSEIIKDPHFLGSFRFGTYVPTQKAIYTVEVPKNVELGYKTFNLDKINLSFKKKENKKSTTYIWEAQNIDDFRNNGNSLSVLNYLPHIIVYIKNYTVKKETIPVLNDVADLYSWYQSLTDQIDDADLTEVYRIAEDLSTGLNTDLEKAKTIFNWVQSNINYIAFEDGLGGFIPRGAASVCTKRYGDCKDMANLLYVMLNHIDIKAYHTWIGTRDRPYSYYDVPTPIVDNHMITVAIINDKTVFLDATDSYVPFGMPSSFTQGKEALIGISDSEFKIIKVPIQEKNKSKTQVETVISLEGDIVIATSKRTMQGYDMVDFVYDAKFKKDDKTDEEYLNNKFQIGNNKTIYSNIKLDNLTTINNTYTTEFDLEIHNYAKSIGSKIFLNLNLEKPLSKDHVLIENQRFGKKIDHKYVRDFITKFNIPEGYQLKSIPKNISNKLNDYGFSFNYKKEKKQLIVHQQIYMNTLALENEDFKAYNAFIKSLLNVYRKSIVLEKTQ